MHKTKPLVSIILPVHNSEKYLTSCLKSLIKQSYKYIEIVAIDDHSIDNSFKILKEFARKDKRIRVYRNVKNYGIAVTLNRLIKKAKSNLIAFMASSDIAYPHRIKKQIEFIFKNPRVVAVGSQCVFINDKNKPLGKSKFPKENQSIYKSPLHGISMQFETILVNKALLPKDVLKFDVNSKPFLYSDIFIKLLNYGKLANLREYLHYRRSAPNIYFSDLRKNVISLAKLWIRSVANSDYHFSIRSLILPLAKR
jgi:glycosyltransferase involved in cell wall biosynthesis